MLTLMSYKRSKLTHMHTTYERYTAYCTDIRYTFYIWKLKIVQNNWNLLKSPHTQKCICESILKGNQDAYFYV